MVSRELFEAALPVHILFQSRNRGTFGFKFVEVIVEKIVIEFQSRNRGTFGFKGTLLEVLLYVL